MLFPDRKRVLYGDNPLVDVICHLSFPRVLAIDNALPVDFQNALVGTYPLLETKKFPVATRSEKGPGRRLYYEFSTADRKVTIALGAEFLGIRAHKYERWEAFREHILTALRTLLATYTLSVFTRVSLNYVNVVDKEALGLKAVRWSELIRNTLIGPLSEPDVREEQIDEHFSQWSMDIDAGDLQVIAGLVVKADTDHVSFLIDNTFSREESIDADEHKILSLLDGFNLEGGRIFRWCIKDRLHEALRPTPIT
jgi:uncharacterized protein (TIGR04255 family)